MTPILIKRPVAFRVQRMADYGTTLSKTEWRYFADEAEANREADTVGADCQALYIRDGTAIVAEWEPIETAPKGEDDFYLVCSNRDLRAPFVVRGSILWGAWSARSPTAPAHLSLDYLTHWMPLPPKPAAKIEPFEPHQDCDCLMCLAERG